MHEFELIKNYFSKISKKNKSALNLNDDVFFDKKRGVVISVDTYNIGTHFYDFKSPDLVIKKILRSSISDLICKGVLPKFYFISQATTNAIMDISVNNKKPVGNGVITCLNMKQAKARKRKGAEAAKAVISILSQK